MNNGTLLGRMPRPDKEEMYKFILDNNARVFKKQFLKFSGGIVESTVVLLATY